jgi:hypothetical protein
MTVSLGKSSSAALERLIQQSTILLEELSPGGGPGTMVNVDNSTLKSHSACIARWSRHVSIVASVAGIGWSVTLRLESGFLFSFVSIDGWFAIKA